MFGSTETYFLNKYRYYKTIKSDIGMKLFLDKF